MNRLACLSRFQLAATLIGVATLVGCGPDAERQAADAAASPGSGSASVSIGQDGPMTFHTSSETLNGRSSYKVVGTNVPLSKLTTAFTDRLDTPVQLGDGLSADQRYSMEVTADSWRAALDAFAVAAAITVTESGDGLVLTPR